MRIRQVKPDFWADVTLADLPESTRLFYVGLWMVSDDAGWLRWDVATVAADLYRFDPRRARERRAGDHFARLVAIERVVLHPCGHAFIPKLTAHQRFTAMDKRVRTIEREHLEKCHPRETAEARGSSTTERNVKERKGTERNVNARERPALAVACAECGVAVGEPCQGVRGERWAVHQSRMTVYKATGGMTTFDEAMRAAGIDTKVIQ